MEVIMSELKSLTSTVSNLPELVKSVKAIKEELMDLKKIKSEISSMKSSLDFVHSSVDDLNGKVLKIEKEVQNFQKTMEEVSSLRHRVESLEQIVRDNEQRSRLNNIEIKGVPYSKSEDLYTILNQIGKKIDCNIAKEQINYIARVPMRGSTDKSIIVSLNNRYLKENFVSAAKIVKVITPRDLGLVGEGKIYINDHLTLHNKILLNKTKEWAKAQGFSFVWVKGAKIFVRKNVTSPKRLIKSSADLN